MFSPKMSAATASPPPNRSPEYVLVRREDSTSTQEREGLEPAATGPQEPGSAKSALRALPAGLAMMAQRSAGRRAGKPMKLVKDGQVVSKGFDLVGPRPQPTMTTLVQTIQVTMGYSSAGYLTTSTVAPVFAGVATSLGIFADATAYTALFDQYRIEQIELWLAPNIVSATAMGEMVTSVDLDDSNVPTSYDRVLAKLGALSTSGQAGHYHKWRPHVAVAEFSGAFTSYGNLPATWIDCASPGVIHYGLKIAAQPSAVATVYNVEIRAVVSFRGVSVP